MKNLFKEVEVESQIISILNKNNTRGNTFHFKWYVEPHHIMGLDIISCNPITKHQFLLLRVEGEELMTIDCLNMALEKITQENNDEYSWVVKWIDEDNSEHVSYFRGKTEYDIREKFYYTQRNTAITEIVMMPLS